MNFCFLDQTLFACLFTRSLAFVQVGQYGDASYITNGQTRKVTKIHEPFVNIRNVVMEISRAWSRGSVTCTNNSHRYIVFTTVRQTKLWIKNRREKMHSQGNTKMFRSYQGILPSSNKLLQMKWDQTYYQEHRRLVSKQFIPHLRLLATVYLFKYLFIDSILWFWLLYDIVCLLSRILAYLYKWWWIYIYIINL